MQIVVGRIGTEMLTNEAGEVTRYPSQSALLSSKCVLVDFAKLSVICIFGVFNCRMGFA